MHAQLVQHVMSQWHKMYRHIKVPPITNSTMEGHLYRYYNGEPLYPFGYGLSCSQFEYKDMGNDEIVHHGNTVGVVVTVKNLGTFEAQEVCVLQSSLNITHHNKQHRPNTLESIYETDASFLNDY